MSAVCSGSADSRFSIAKSIDQKLQEDEYRIREYNIRRTFFSLFSGHRDRFLFCQPVSIRINRENQLRHIHLEQSAVIFIALEEIFYLYNQTTQQHLSFSFQSIFLSSHERQGVLPSFAFPTEKKKCPAVIVVCLVSA
jgi:hypothetical protein